MAKKKMNLSYDKKRRTIVAAPGSVEEKWTAALAKNRALRNAIREAIGCIKDGDPELAQSILENELGDAQRQAKRFLQSLGGPY